MSHSEEDLRKIREAFGSNQAKATTPAANVAGAAIGAQAPIAQTLADKYPLVLGKVPIPYHLETRHILMVGTTGSGKSQAIYGNLSAIRAREERAILVDHSAEFLQRYYRPGVDVIFNPFDMRGVGWSPFNEIRRVYDFMRMARAIIPSLGGDNNQDWVTQAQTLVCNVLKALWFKGPKFRSNEALLYYLTEAPNHGRDSKSLQGLLAEMGRRPDTPNTSAKLFEVGSERGLSIVLGSFIAPYLEPFQYLQEGDFSITDWIKNESGKGWLFASYTDASYAAIKSLFSIVVSSAIQSGLELSESSTRRFYFVLDEFSSLDKIDAVDDALTKLRKRGGIVIAGIQSTAQLVTGYGKEGAQTLLSCFGNVLALRVADDDTANKCSGLMGKVERLRETQTTSSSEGGSGINASSSTSQGTSTTLVLEDAIHMGKFYALEDLTGYARMAGHSKKTAFLTSVPVSSLPLVTIAEETRPGVLLELC